MYIANERRPVKIEYVTTRCINVQTYIIYLYLYSYPKLCFHMIIESGHFFVVLFVN